MSDIDDMSKYWDVFKGLKSTLFSILRDGFYQLNIDKDEVRRTVYADAEFSQYADKIGAAFSAWQEKVNFKLCYITKQVKAKVLITEIAEVLFKEFEGVELLDKYDVYQILLAYWNDVMADDVYIIIQDGYSAAREVEYDVEIIEKGRNVGQERVKGWNGKLIPKDIIMKEYFSKESSAIVDVEAVAEATQAKLDELIEEYTSEGGALFEYLDDNSNLIFKEIEKVVKDFDKSMNHSEDTQVLFDFIELTAKTKEYGKLIKQLKVKLDEKVIAKYQELRDNEILELLVNKKWYYSIFQGIEALYTAISHDIANRIVELAERYDETLSVLQVKVSCYEKIVKSHLERMGYTC